MGFDPEYLHKYFIEYSFIAFILPGVISIGWSLLNKL